MQILTLQIEFNVTLKSSQQNPIIQYNTVKFI